MPRNKKGLEHKPEHISHLKRLMTQKFGRTVDSAPHCLELSKKIINVCGKTVSKDVLREFYGLIRKGNQPTTNTLDIFSKFCGYKNWVDFVAAYNRNNANRIYFLLMKSINEKKIDLGELMKLVKDLGQCKAAYELIQHSISIAAGNKDEEFFKKVFSFEILFNLDDEYRYEIFYTVQLLGSHVQQNKWLQEIAISHYYNLPFKDDYFVEWFVDLGNYDLYYGKLLENYYNAKQNDRNALVFYSLNVAEYKLKRGEYAYLDKLLELKINFEKDNNILVGRWYGMSKSFCNALGEELCTITFDEIREKQSDSGDLITFLYHACKELFYTTAYSKHRGIDTKEEYQQIVELVEAFVPKWQLLLSHWGNANLNQLKLFFVASLCEIENSNGQPLFNTIEPIFFDRYCFNELSTLYEKTAKKISYSIPFSE